jgi:predicted DNA-binding transcriptional regulator AlpA
MSKEEEKAPDTSHKLPEIGYLRLKQIIGDKKARPQIPAIVPVGKTNWWQGVKSGLYPKSLKLGPRITVWRVEDIMRLVSRDTSDVE